MIINAFQTVFLLCKTFKLSVHMCLSECLSVDTHALIYINLFYEIQLCSQSSFGLYINSQSVYYIMTLVSKTIMHSSFSLLLSRNKWMGWGLVSYSTSNLCLYPNGFQTRRYIFCSRSLHFLR